MQLLDIWLNYQWDPGLELPCFLTTDSDSCMVIGMFIQVLYQFLSIFLEFVDFVCFQIHWHKVCSLYHLDIFLLSIVSALLSFLILSICSFSLYLLPSAFFGSFWCFPSNFWGMSSLLITRACKAEDFSPSAASAALHKFWWAVLVLSFGSKYHLISIVPCLTNELFSGDFLNFQLYGEFCVVGWFCPFLSDLGLRGMSGLWDLRLACVHHVSA